jgi:autotransporter-associated beta strand protein
MAATLGAMHTEASAQTYVWNGPGGTSVLPWSNSTNWLGGMVPVSGPTLSLEFGANSNVSSYIAANDLGVMNINRISLSNAASATGAQATANLRSYPVAGGSAVGAMRFTGDNPAIIYNRGNGATVGGISTGFSYGIILAPTSGNLSILGDGNGLLNLGNFVGTTVGSGITGAAGIDINASPLLTVNLVSAAASSGFASNFSGGVRLYSGRLQINANQALGTGPLTMLGGVIRSSAAAIVCNNPVVLTNDLAVSQASDLTFTGPITGGGALKVLSSGYFDGLKITLSTAAAYTGPTIIEQSAIRNINLPRLTVTAQGSINSTSRIDIGQGGALWLTGNTNDTRIPNNAPVRMDAGVVVIQGDTGGGTSTSETLGNVTASGLCGFVVNSVSGTLGSQFSNLSFGSLSRVDNATLIFRGPYVGSSGSGPTGTQSFAGGLTGISDPLGPSDPTNTPIVPFAAGDPLFQAYGGGNAFITYDVGGVRMIPFSDPSVIARAGTPLDAGSANRNVWLVGTINVAGQQRVNALGLAGSTSSTAARMTGTGTVRVYSGCVLAGGNNVLGPVNTIAGPTIDFGDKTGFFHMGSPIILSAGSSITGSAGVVVSGTQSVAINGLSFNSTSLANPFTGGFYINGGLVAFNRDDQLGAPGEPVVFNGGVMYFNLQNSNLTLNRPMRLGPAGGGMYALTGSTFEVASDITGSGGLTVWPPSNAGQLTLSGNNTFTGPVSIFASGGTGNAVTVVAVSSDANLGASSEVRLCGGNLRLLSSATFTKTLNFISAATLDSNGFSPTFSSPLYGTSGLNRTLVKMGDGSITLAGSSPHWSGTMAIDAGALVIAGEGRFPQLFSATMNYGGEFRIDNTTTNVTDRVSDDARLFIPDGGTFRFVGTPGGASSEVLGGISLSDSTSNSAGSSILSIETGAAGSAVVTARGLVTGAGTLFKRGSGILELSFSTGNDYSGGTQIQNGTLRVSNTSGSATGTGPVYVDVNGTLDGSGLLTISGGLTVEGAVSGGDDFGTLTVISASVSINGKLRSDIRDGASDTLAVVGNLSLGSNASLELPDTNNYSTGGTFTLANYTGTLTGHFAHITGLDSSRYTIDYGTGSASAITITVSAPCPADFNQDGGVDGGDIESFFSAWEAADTSADVNYDGGVDGGDIETFFHAWEAGGC